ncbi:MAG: acyl-CoA reductase [Chitinophagales bacterium]|nr:acyl-CoA reductase [Chitinophagales bacterium]MCZ2394800.1 acyl-CoA reductase [Chitinophagales bacterium]
MELINRVNSLVKLGQYISEDNEKLQQAIRLAGIKNHWFTVENCYKALQAIAFQMLSAEKLNTWLSQYDFSKITPKNIGIIAAGNIPLVSFHDIICVLISGHHLHLKTSEKDNILIPHLLNQLTIINQEWESFIHIDNRWKEINAVIATGSNNSGRYFEYYFGKKPNIIRKNRHSVAVLKGNEDKDTLFQLGKDVFEYFGLGCRNISLIWLPKGYHIENLITAWQPFSTLLNFHSYKNNFDYQRTIYLMNGTPIVDCDFVNMVDNISISSPISCINLAYYEDESEIIQWLNEQNEQIQCVVNFEKSDRHVSFGATQIPQLNDYADGIDTIQFLIQV